jgi:tRNA(Ile)-lysidine synthase TilS/MesJ
MVLHQRKLPFHLNLMALHVNPGFEPDNHKVLLDWLSEHGIAGYAEISDIGPRAHSIENYKNSPCFFCSWHRRKRLFQLVKKFKLTHLALGHTADDLVHNFFLNLAYSGRVEGMFPRESFFKGEFELIRPLLLVEKRLIKGAVKDWGLPVVENPCPSAQNSKREQIKVWLQGLWAEDKRIRKNIFSALKRWQIQGSGKP